MKKAYGNFAILCKKFYILAAKNVNDFKTLILWYIHKVKKCVQDYNSKFKNKCDYFKQQDMLTFYQAWRRTIYLKIAIPLGSIRFEIAVKVHVNLLADGRRGPPVTAMTKEESESLSC